MQPATTGKAPPRLPLSGYRVGIVAHHGRQEQAEVVVRAGAEAVLGPVVDAVPAAAAEGLEATTMSMLATPPAALVLTSAAGTAAWLGVAERLGRDRELRELLASTPVLAHGAGSADLAATGVAVDGGLPADPDEAGRCLVAAVGGLARRPVAVQVDLGDAVPRLAGGLRSAGLEVVEVAVPAAGLPADRRPAHHLLDSLARGRIEALTLTSPAEVRHLLALAGDAGLGDEVVGTLNREVAAVCLTRACQAVAAAAGLVDTVRPDQARVGAMVETLARRLAERRARFVLAGTAVALQGVLAVVDGDEVWLADRERALLAALARRPGTVVAKAELLERVWRGEEVGDHAVEVAVARLRRRLGRAGAGLQTVPRRGYRLVPG